MGKEFLPLFLDFNENTQDLSDDQCGRLIRALVDYANGREPNIEGTEMIAFRFLKSSIDRNEKLSAKRAAAGSKGGNQTQANRSKNKKTEANESKVQQNDINTNINNKANNKTNNNERFDRFWAAYPRKVAKPNALKAFNKINPDDELLMTMLSAIENQKKSEQWIKDSGQFIPHPATWLNQRRWEDDLPNAVKGKTVNAQDYEQRDYTGVQDELIRRQNERFAARLGRVG